MTIAGASFEATVVDLHNFANRHCIECHMIFKYRGKLASVHAPQLVRVWGFEATVADFRSYATLFWVGKTLLTGYTLVSLQNRDYVGAVSMLIEVSSMGGTLPVGLMSNCSDLVSSNACC